MAPWMVTLRGPGEVHPVLFEGPLVRLGACPGPGGVLLQTGDGIRDHHCTLMVHPSGEVELVPLPGATVRVSPYLAGDWSTVPPLRQSVFIDRGAFLFFGNSHGECIQFMKAWVPLVLVPPQLCLSTPSRLPSFALGACIGGLAVLMANAAMGT